MSDALVYTREQIQTILTEFINVLSLDSLKQELQQAAPDEEKMSHVIEKYQSQIFAKHGIEPKRGFEDLQRVSSVYKDDKAIIQLLHGCAVCEDMAMNEALSKSSGGPPTHHAPGPAVHLPPSLNPQQLDPALLQQNMMMANQIASNPEMLAKMKEQLEQKVAQNPALKAQLEQLQAMINATSPLTSPAMKPPVVEDMDNDME